MLDQDEFLMEILDMFRKPIYVNKNNFKNVFSQLNKMNFFKTEEVENCATNSSLNVKLPFLLLLGL